MPDSGIHFFETVISGILVENTGSEPVADVKIRVTVLIQISKAGTLAHAVIIQSPRLAPISKITPPVAQEKPVRMMFIVNKKIQETIFIDIGPESTVTIQRK